MRLVSTVGWVPEVVIYPAKILNPEEIVVFHGHIDNKEEKARFEKTKNEIVTEIGMNVRFVEVNPFDMADCIRKMKKYVNDESIVNITGGTKLMALTLALLATYRPGGEVPIIYVTTEDEPRLVRVPVSFTPEDLRIDANTVKWSILKILLESPSGKMRSKELRKIIGKERIRKGIAKGDENDEGLSQGTFSEAKKELKKYNLIAEEKLGREIELSVKEAAWFFKDFLGVSLNE